MAKEFGLKNGKNLLLTTKTGNARYRAPELFDTTLDHYSASVDVSLHNSSFGASLPVSTLCFLDLTYFLKKSKFSNNSEAKLLLEIATFDPKTCEKFSHF